MRKNIDWSLCQGADSRIYVNLHNHLISVTQKIDRSYLVVGHTDNLVIEYPQFYVSQSGRERVIKQQKKNVHAYAYGRLLGRSIPNLPVLAEIYYCPYRQNYFSWKDTGERIDRADLLVVADNRVFCSVVNTNQLQLL